MVDSRTVKYAAFFLLAAASPIRTEDLAAPLLKLDPQPPVELSSDNRLAYKQNAQLLQQEQKRNVHKLRERSISWIGIVALLGAAALLFWPKRKEKLQVTAPAIDPKKTAYDRLEALQRDKPDAGQLYVGLTSTVREYLEKTFQIKAITETTEEFLSELAGQQLFNPETKQALVEFLQKADEVKFGQYQPSDEEREAAIAAAKKILDAS